jgi:hypothetical protein
MRWLEPALGPPAIARRLAEHGLRPGPLPPVQRTVPAQLQLPVRALTTFGFSMLWVAPSREAGERYRSISTVTSCGTPS